MSKLDTGGGVSGHIQREIRQDWDNREQIEIITCSIKKISDFLNSFDMSCRSRLSILNEKLTKLERRIEYIEARVSKGLPFGQKRFNPTAPEKGAFPLDHDGECKRSMFIYMKCLRKNGNENSLCRKDAMEYLKCRMEKNLMLKEDFSKLGYSDIDAEGKPRNKMGANASQLEKEIGSDLFPANEHYFGLVNFGNTCYCNSVLQALYFCRPFREKVLQYKQQQKNQKKETLLTCLADLFYTIATQKKKVGSLPPKKFIQRLRKENEVFDNYLQQDAHEFLNYLLNTVADLLSAEKVQGKKPEGKEGKPEPTWVHEIFQGTLTNETRCLNCETVSSKDEDFLDLSVDVEQNTSITHCLRGFSNTETLCAEHKYFCEVCCSKQEAQKRMRVKKLPHVLALHLKRFKYVEQLNRFTKLSYRVVFPLELRLFNTSDDAMNPERLYDLTAVVIHCGSGPNRGHYISIVKSHGFWLLFDDDIVDKIDQPTIEDFYGLTSDLQKNSESGYILIYQSKE